MADTNEKDGGDQPEDFAALLAASEQQARAAGRQRRRASAGDRVRGRITSIGSEVATIELEGGAGEALIDTVELRDRDGKLSLAVGDQVDAAVVQPGAPGRPAMLRRSAGRGPSAAADLAGAVQTGLPVEGTVAAANKGGVEVSLAGGVRGFCPVSQLDLAHVADAAAFVGRHLAFRVVRFEDDRRGPNVVLSRRALLEEEERRRATVTREKLVVGAVLPGVVAAVKDYGAFIDLGGIQGMLHVSEMGFSRVDRPADVLAVGAPITVQVIKIEKTDDPRRPERVALSLKSLEPDPWTEAAARLTEGARARGRVTRVEPFGAFVELSPGVEGLVHVGELGGGRPLRHAREAVAVGATLDVVVKAIDKERRRLSLAPASPDESLDADARAVLQGAAPAKLGTLGDLLKSKSNSKG